jgi:hypothetical protein
MKRKTLLSGITLMVFFSLVFLASCKKDSNDTPANTDVIYNIAASMSGANEVPANTTTGTGTVTGTYNATSNVLTYAVTWSGLTGTATAGHFHSPAAAGANATPLIFFNLNNNGSAGTANGSIQLTEPQEQDLLAGKFYANIHTVANTGGEIRGQVAATR